MIDVLRKVIINVLTALYQPFGLSVIMTVLLMFLYMYAKEKGWKTLLRQWVIEFKTSQIFRREFFLLFYVVMILYQTLLNRNMWQSPIVNVIGVWGLYNHNGEFTTEAIENLVLFIPFTVLLLWNFQKKIIGEEFRFCTIIWKSIWGVFVFSLSIELIQLFLRLGTFQLSDLFYNTLGGLIGGLIYWCGYKLTHRHKE